MVSSRKTRQARKTLLVVGEGDSEVAFIKHLRQIYCANGAGVSVTVRNAHGKGPENVINTAMALKRSGGYEQVAALLDTDLVWSPTIRKAAQKSRIVLVGSTPCLEGLLLAVLGVQVPERSDRCKDELHRRVGTKMLDADDYKLPFTRDVIQNARSRVPSVELLLNLIEGIA